MKIYLVILTLLLCAGCSAIRETSLHPMEDNIYKVPSQRNKRYYTVVEEYKITMHTVKKTAKGWITDTTAGTISMSTNNPQSTQPVTFITSTFDLDVLTILFKYRPYSSGFPNQLNTNFNAAGFIGHRSDYYILSYQKNPLDKLRHKVNHFAYSVGFFGGLGSTNMNPFVTGNRLLSEYDGVVITKGIVGLVGIGNLTFGAAIGLDI
jgi:hypothetical protein